MIPIPPQLAALGLKPFLCAGLAATLWLHGCHYGHEQEQGETQKVENEFTAFKERTKAQGEAAEKEAARIAAADKLNKEKANEKYRDTVVYLSDELDRLRKLSTPGSVVPPASGTSRRPDLACFDRAELNSAIDELIVDLQSQAAKGSAGTAIADTAKIWVQGMRK